MVATLAVHVRAVGSDRSLAAGFSSSDRRACGLAVERFALLLVKQHRAYGGFRWGQAQQGQGEGQAQGRGREVGTAGGGFAALQTLQAQLEALRADIRQLVTRDDQYVVGRMAPDLLLPGLAGGGDAVREEEEEEEEEAAGSGGGGEVPTAKESFHVGGAVRDPLSAAASLASAFETPAGGAATSFGGFELLADGQGDTSALVGPDVMADGCLFVDLTSPIAVGDSYPKAWDIMMCVLRARDSVLRIAAKAAVVDMRLANMQATAFIENTFVCVLPIALPRGRDARCPWRALRHGRNGASAITRGQQSEALCALVETAFMYTAFVRCIASTSQRQQAGGTVAAASAAAAAAAAAARHAPRNRFGEDAATEGVHTVTMAAIAVAFDSLARMRVGDGADGVEAPLPLSLVLDGFATCFDCYNGDTFEKVMNSGPSRDY
jgi:hypothetical protein